MNDGEMSLMDVHWPPAQVPRVLWLMVVLFSIEEMKKKPTVDLQSNVKQRLKIYVLH